MKRVYLIVKVEPYTGRDTFIHCGTFGEEYETVEKPIFCVVNVGTGIMIDGGYRTFAEAQGAWPDAVNVAVDDHISFTL